MRIPSAYSVYRVVFEYPKGADGTRITFGRAIADTLSVIAEVMDSGDTSAITAYERREFARSLAIQFLGHFLGLSCDRSGDFASRWTYTHAVISLDRALFPHSRKRGLDIEFPYLVAPARTEIIIPTFGPPKNMSGELGVLLSLFHLGTVQPAVPSTVKTITYWDLRGGTECSTQKADVALADHGVVLAACSELMAL